MGEDATTIELPAGGYVMLYGERLQEELAQAANPEVTGVPGAGGAAGSLAPTPVKATPMTTPAGASTRG